MLYCVDRMNKGLIHRWNERVKKEDTVIFLGDFCFRGNDGGKDTLSRWEEQLNGKIIFIAGNHDKKSNGLKPIITNLLGKFGGYKFLAQHQPPTNILEIPEDCDLIIHGHTHLKERVSWLGKTPLYNLCVEATNFYPQKLSEIILFHEQTLRYKDNQ